MILNKLSNEMAIETTSVGFVNENLLEKVSAGIALHIKNIELIYVRDRKIINIRVLSNVGEKNILAAIIFIKACIWMS